MKKCLFICKKRIDNYGKSFGLLNSATFVAKYLSSEGIPSRVVTAIDGNDIDRLVTEADVDYVMIEAIWVTPAKIDELLSLKRHKYRHWVIRIHSKIPFIANEGIAFEWLAAYASLCRKHKNLYIAPNSLEFTNDLKSVISGIRSVYLPNIYMKPEYHVVSGHEGAHINIGCFGALRPMKNTLIQAVAAIEFGNQRNLSVHFHINGNLQEQSGDQAYKNLKSLFVVQRRHLLVEHNWMDHHAFIRVINKMDLGMQVSLTESFNLVTADFVAFGIPTIGSPDIAWLSRLYQANPNSSQHIMRKLNFMYEMRSFGLHNINKFYLYIYNCDAKDHWLKFI